MSTATEIMSRARRTARKIVSQQDRTERAERIERTATRLAAEQTSTEALKRIAAEREAAERAEAAALEEAPEVVLTYGNTKVTILFAAKDDITRSMLTEAVRRVTRLMAGAHLSYVGRKRAEAKGEGKHPVSALEQRLAETIEGECHLVTRSGLMKVEQSRGQRVV